MELLNHLGTGFSVATQGINLLYAFIGAIIGVMILLGIYRAVAARRGVARTGV